MLTPKGLIPALFSAAAIAITLSSPLIAEPMSEAFPDLIEGLLPEYAADTAKLNLLHGKVALEGGTVALDVPDQFYVLGAKDAQYVLEKLWDNPPDETILGMVFPTGKSPMDGTWGLTLSFDGMGYVSDADAGSYDYTEMLGEMQADTVASNEWRRQNGFAEVSLLGWAEAPHYDAVERKLYWAKRLAFADSETETLNYDIRVLGRKGVAVASFIAPVEGLQEVKAAAPEVLKMISFTEGNRYADYQPGVDTVAAVGIGGLIAGKVLAKTGLLVVLLAFLKKGGFLLILMPLSRLWSKIRGKKDEQV